MGTDREASGGYLTPLSIEEANQRELEYVRWHAEVMLQRVTAAAKASADAAARVAQLEATFAQAKRDREAHQHATAQRDNRASQVIDKGAIFPHPVAD